MKSLRNDYARLKQDNVDESVKLQYENRRIIERITDYISAKKVSLFELEVIKKDLIGIAAEAETEEISMEEKLGVSEKEFADNLSLETEGKSLLEQSLLFGRYIFFVAWIVYMITFWFSGFPKEYGISSDIVFFIMIYSFYDDVLVKRISKKLLYSKKPKLKKAPFDVLSFALLVVWFMIPMDKYFLIKGNGWGISIGLLAISVIMMVINHMYWNRQSEKYNWR